MIFVAAEGGLGELASLVRVQGLFYVVDLGNEVLLFWFCGGEVTAFGVVERRGGSSGAHALPLAAHVPFCVSLDSGKHLWKLFTFTRGHERKFTLLMALSQLALVGNPAVECR